MYLLRFEVLGPNPLFPEESGGCHGFLVVVVLDASVLTLLLGSCVPVPLTVSVVVRLASPVPVVLPTSDSVTLAVVGVVTPSVAFVNPDALEVDSVELLAAGISVVVVFDDAVEVSFSVPLVLESVTFVGCCVTAGVLSFACDAFPGIWVIVVDTLRVSLEKVTESVVEDALVLLVERGMFVALPGLWVTVDTLLITFEETTELTVEEALVV